MDAWIPLASGIMGVLAFCAARLISQYFNNRLPVDHAKYRDQILNRLHYLLNLQAEVADVERDLAELWEKAPDHQALLIAGTVERAATLPTGLLKLGERFGFKLPKYRKDLEDATEQAPVSTAPAPEVEGAEVVEMNGWTGTEVR